MKAKLKLVQGFEMTNPKNQYSFRNNPPDELGVIRGKRLIVYPEDNREFEVVRQEDDFSLLLVNGYYGWAMDKNLEFFDYSE